MLSELHKELGIPDDYGSDGLKPAYREATDLVEVGENYVGRMQRLSVATADAWREMQGAAAADGVVLVLVSGYRSFEYQAGLIRKKIESGQSLGEILAVNAAPGFSEHHTGRAIDIATPASEPLTEEFEETAAFTWLSQNASRFGFSMTYPRNNPQGFIYEPWHWAKSAV
ncbi:MAG TPA: D-alanyl-D-alanine carboxypeptidase family protein [Woeseiaceae bacterium]|nr:D-alanyl-D-alanine carboxypeptidase family protein [Woeseiaceae bacterium]